MISAEVIATRIKWGVLALPVAGLIGILGTALLGPIVDPTVDPQTFSEQSLSASYAWSTLLLSVANVLWLFGFFALYAYLASSRAERWALAAMIINVVATAFTIGSLAVEEVATRLVGQAFLEGRQDIYEVLTPLSTLTPTAVLAIVATFSGTVVGNILLAIAIWRSGILPQGSAILIAGSAVLFGANFLSVWIAVLTYVLNTLGFGWIALSILRQPAVEVAGEGAGARVR